MHERFALDLTAPLAGCEAVAGRSWPWLQTRIRGLLFPGTRTHRALFPDSPPAPRGRR